MSNLRTTVKWPNSGESISSNALMYAQLEPAENPGYVAVETVLIRLNTSFTPSGRFPVYSNTSLPDVNGTETRIGYDAAVCVQKYEPWIIETYNTSIVSPSALRIVGKGYSNTSLPPSGNIRGAPITNTRYLNTTDKDVAFWVAHSNGVHQMWKDNDRGSYYVPCPTVGLFVPSRTTFLLTSTYSIGRFFHRRHGSWGVHRTLSRPVRHHPCTGQCGVQSTVSCGVGTCNRTGI